MQIRKSQKTVWYKKFCTIIFPFICCCLISLSLLFLCMFLACSLQYNVQLSISWCIVCIALNRVDLCQLPSSSSSSSGLQQREKGPKLFWYLCTVGAVHFSRSTVECRIGIWGHLKLLKLIYLKYCIYLTFLSGSGGRAPPIPPAHGWNAGCSPWPCCSGCTPCTTGPHLLETRAKQNMMNNETPCGPPPRMWQTVDLLKDVVGVKNCWLLQP